MIKTGIDIIEISRFDKMDKLDLFEKKAVSYTHLDVYKRQV